MITNITDYFIEILSEEGKELYNEELDISTNRITVPNGTDLSNWIERDIILNDNYNTNIHLEYPETIINYYN